jgi:7-cyano-7-deazaguanine synthase in queuosine biosynthesis
MTHLVMVSGGPDSAWCLRHVLLTTDAPVIALHVEILDAGGRAPFEMRAFQSICDLLERIRPIERMTCGLTVPLSCVAADWVLLGGIMGGVIAGRPEITDVWGGTVIEDGDVSERDAMGAHIAMLTARNSPAWIERPVTWHYEPRHLNKRAIRREIGEELWSETWSCRAPIAIGPCGRCFACERRSATDWQNS